MKKIAPILYTLYFILYTSVPLAHADWLIDRSGSLVQVDGAVLGDDTNLGEAEIKSAVPVREAQKRTTERVRENAKDKQETVREAAKQKLENQIEARKKIQEKTGQSSTFELKSEARKLRINQETQSASDPALIRPPIEMKEGESLYVEQEDGVKARINAVKDGRMELIKNRVKTNSDFELKVGEKNEISVTLPNGKEKEITLPDKALENLISKGILTETTGEDGTTDYQLTAGKNGDPVYPVEGQVEKKLFGLLKLKFAQKLEVAATTTDDGTVQAGDVVESQSRETSPWRRLLERFSR